MKWKGKRRERRGGEEKGPGEKGERGPLPVTLLCVLSAFVSGEQTAVYTTVVGNAGGRAVWHPSRRSAGERDLASFL